MRSEPGSGPTPPAAAGRCSPEAPGCRSWGGKSPQLDSVHRGRQRQRKQPQRFPPPPRRHCSCRVSARPARFCRPAAPVRSAGEKQGGSGGRSRKQPGRRGSGRPAPLPRLCPGPAGAALHFRAFADGGEAGWEKGKGRGGRRKSRRRKSSPEAVSGPRRRESVSLWEQRGGGRQRAGRNGFVLVCGERPGERGGAAPKR